jgi:hypothetical protein
MVGTLASPVGHIADELFWVHMAEHLVLADAGGVLLVLGFTGPVLAPVLRLPVLGRMRVLAHPAPALGLWALNLFPLARAGAARGRRHQRGRARRPARAVRRARGEPVDGPCSARCRGPRGSDCWRR